MLPHALVIAAAIGSAQPSLDKQPAAPPTLLHRVAGTTTPTTSLDGLSPEERMQRRYPQPVKVGDLIGLPLLDDQDRTLGTIQSVVRTPEGKVRLIISFGGLLGWGQRLIAVPIEVVAIAGRQLAALDMTRAELEAAPTWSAVQTQPIASNEIVRVGLYRR